MQDQGLVVDGALGKVNIYERRAYVDAICKMSKPLLEHGTLESSLNYLKWIYNYDKRLFPESYLETMDYFYTKRLPASCT